MGHLPDLTIRQLEYLAAVADHPTWADAAAAVGVSASALSQGLGELERRIGVTLFERQGRRRLIRPTAQPVVAHARHVLGLTGDLVGWANRLKQTNVGRVRLGMIDVAAVQHYPAVVRRFRLDHPEVDMHLVVAPSAQLLAQLRDGELDLVVCVEPPTMVPGVITRPLIKEPLIVLAPAAGTVGDPASWGPWLTFPVGSHTRDQIVTALRSHGCSTTVTAVSHQPEVLLEMVRIGLGWTVLPLDGRLDLDGIRKVETLQERQLVLARRDGAAHDPAVDVVAAALVAR